MNKANLPTLWFMSFVLGGTVELRPVIAADDSFTLARQRMVAEQLAPSGRGKSLDVIPDALNGWT